MSCILFLISRLSSSGAVVASNFVLVSIPLFASCLHFFSTLIFRRPRIKVDSGAKGVENGKFGFVVAYWKTVTKHISSHGKVSGTFHSQCFFPTSSFICFVAVGFVSQMRFEFDCDFMNFKFIYNVFYSRTNATPIEFTCLWSVHIGTCHMPHI